MSDTPQGLVINESGKPVSIFMDGRHLQVDSHMTVLEAADAHGIYIPTLCHDPRLEPAARCGLCLVEIGDEDLVHACETPVSEGLEIVTLNPSIPWQLRRNIAETIVAELEK